MCVKIPRAKQLRSSKRTRYSQAALGVVANIDIISHAWVDILTASVLGTAVTLLITGMVFQALMRRIAIGLRQNRLDRIGSKSAALRRLHRCRGICGVRRPLAEDGAAKPSQPGPYYDGHRRRHPAAFRNSLLGLSETGRTD